MKPKKTALNHVLNILRVISDPASRSKVVLGNTEIEDPCCGTHRCVLGWYNHIYRGEYQAFSFNADRSAQQFGIDAKTYLKIFGTGSDVTDSPLNDNFDEAKTRAEMRRRIKVVEEVLANA